MIELLKELSLLRGVSGEEGAVREAIIEQIKDHCTYSVDALGNIIALKKGRETPKNTLQLSAHMDEVGFIITHIDDEGLLRFTNVGGVDPKVTVGKTLMVGARGRAVYGVVGLKPVHLLADDEKGRVPKMEDLTLDIGANSREEAEHAVSLGDRATFVSDFIEFGHGLYKCKALDDRAGCAMLIELIRGPELAFDCAFTFTVQEENGCVGGQTAAFAVKPDIAIALETTTAGDIAEAPAHKTVCRLGQGPVLSFMDRGTVYSPELFRLGMETAKERGIRAQAKEGVYGGNESRSLQAARAGAKVLAVSLPCRYLHSPACVLKKSDIEDMLRLLPALIERFGNL